MLLCLVMLEVQGFAGASQILEDLKDLPVREGSRITLLRVAAEEVMQSRWQIALSVVTAVAA